MAYQQTNAKRKTYFKTDSNNKNIFRNSHSTLSWKALHAAIKDNQNNLDMYFVKFTELAQSGSQRANNGSQNWRHFRLKFNCNNYKCAYKF